MEIVVALGSIVIVNVVAWLTPGPNMIAVMGASLSYGRRHGLATGAGLAAAATLWATLAMLGVSIFFEVFPGVVLALKLAGAAYLVWLGISSFRSAVGSDKGPELRKRADKSIGRSFLTGFLVSITNPKAALFFGSVMTAFVPAGSEPAFLTAVVVLCGLLALILHAVTATLFSTRIAFDFFSRARRWVAGVFGVCFVGMGGAVAYAALKRQ